MVRLVLELAVFLWLSLGHTYSQGWWNSNWQYRKQTTVTAGSIAIPVGYSVPIQFDHAALVTAGKSLSSGNDVRLVYWNGSTYTELDRILDDTSSWNRATTKVWFKTQASIAASGSDVNYYMYYGNASAGSPPANGMNVFLFHDGFSSVDGTKWDSRGSYTVSGGIATVPQNTEFFAKPAYAFGTNTRWEFRVKLGCNANAMNFANATSDTNNHGWDANFINMWAYGGSQYAADNAVNGHPITSSNFTPGSIALYHTYIFNREGTSNVRYFEDATQVANNVSQVPTLNMMPFIFNDLTGCNLLVDWIRVRKYVTTEPTSSLGTEGALAVQLASFTARTSSLAQGVTLQWTTVSETNNYGFEIQRKRVGQTAFATLPGSFTPGHGTTLQLQNYSFTDGTVTPGQWSYRLLQIDLDGTLNFSEAVVVDVLTDVREVAPAMFSLSQNFPNPFNPECEIKFSIDATAHTTLVVYNALGQEVARLFDDVAEPGQYYRVKLSGQNLASGIYLYRLQSGKRSDFKKLLLLK